MRDIYKRYDAKRLILPGAALFLVAGGIALWLRSEAGGCPDGHFRAAYFSNPSLSGEPGMTRCEALVDKDWQLEGPSIVRGSDSFIGVQADEAPAIHDGFSVSWTGTFAFDEGDYVVTAGHDDGMRVWVDDQLLIDAWKDSPYTEDSAQFRVSGGPHLVRVEYYENLGSASARVSWAPVGDVEAR